MTIGIIDRFEKGVDEDFAIIELADREILILAKSELPNNAKEGDKVSINEDTIEIVL